MAGEAPADRARAEEVARTDWVCWGYALLRRRDKPQVVWIHRRVLFATLLAFVCVSAAAVPRRDEASVEELKARLSSANVSDRPHICVEIAEKQLTETDKLYAASDVEKAQASLTDVVTYSEKARDYAIQTHKYQKQAEIAVRGMARRLNEILHSLGHEEQAPVKDAVTKLERVRDDLLSSMFKKAGK